MDPQRWQAVEVIFHQALERPPDGRRAWLEQACGADTELRTEVETLLESDRVADGGFVGSRVEQAVLELHEEHSQTPRTMEGHQVGPYRLIRELGRGGMGAVYLAARADQQYESEVAIKLVRPGLDTDFILRRFRRERQILAGLHHPNIARLFDGGTTDAGAPYLVMEYVKGSWITRYADENRLSIESRLRLFLPVCAAMEYAHRNFVVHRDLKPGNILIDERGSPKLLDFGISKLLRAEQRDSDETQGVGMITPDYASPEQVLGEPVTISSDVYSLGAVLYELLSGVRPHRIEGCTPLALERAICQEPTMPPSAAVRDNPAVVRRIAGDLDNIVLQAMQKEPALRYASPEHLASDLQRFLEHRPVLARPASLGYRARKYVRRNQLVLALAALAALVVLGGAVAAEYQARVARGRFQQVRKLATTFVFDVEEAARDLPGAMRVRQMIARTGLEYLDNLARSSTRDWTLKRELATAYRRIGEVQGGSQNSNLGDPGAALASLNQAGKLLDEVLQHTPSDRRAFLDRMTVFFNSGNLHRQMGDMRLAAAACEEGLRRSESLLAINGNDIDAVQYAGVFRLDLSRIRLQQGALDASARESSLAIPLLERLAAARPEDRESHSNIAAAHARLGAVLADLGRREEALASYRRGVAELEKMHSRNPNDVHVRHELMLAHSHVGDTLGNPAYDNAGDLPGARAAYTQMVEQARMIYDADRADNRAVSDYGIALLRFGIATSENRGKDKRTALERAHGLLSAAALRNPRNAPNGTHKAWCELELGNLFRNSGDRVSAGRYYRNAIATAESVLAGSPSDNSGKRWLIAAARSLAEEQARAGDRTQALSNLEKAIQLGSGAEGGAPRTSVSLRSIVPRAWQAAGSVYALLGDREAARAWYRRALAEWRELEKQKGFLPPYRREMEADSQALAALGGEPIGQAGPR